MSAPTSPRYRAVSKARSTPPGRALAGKAFLDAAEHGRRSSRVKAVRPRLRLRALRLDSLLPSADTASDEEGPKNAPTLNPSRSRHFQRASSEAHRNPSTTAVFLRAKCFDLLRIQSSGLEPGLFDSRRAGSSKPLQQGTTGVSNKTAGLPSITIQARHYLPPSQPLMTCSSRPTRRLLVDVTARALVLGIGFGGVELEPDANGELDACRGAAAANSGSARCAPS